MSDRQNPPSPPKVSILVPAWNEGKTVSSCIESFFEIKYPNRELIVIAGGDDDTYEIANGYTDNNITVLKQLPEGKNAALNLGLKSAKGEIIVLTDADCIMNAQWFDSIIKPIVEGGEGIVSGNNQPLRSQLNNPFVLFQFSYTAAFKHEKNEKYLDGKNAALKREILDEIGGFDEGALTGTDLSLKYILLDRGFKIRFVPESVISTRYPDSKREYLKQRSRWLRNFIIHGKKHGDSNAVSVFFEQTIIGATMILTPFFLALFKPLIYPWTAVFLLAFYNRTRLIKTSRKTMPELKFNSIYPRLPLYIIVEYMAGFLSLLDYILPWRRRRW